MQENYSLEIQNEDDVEHLNELQFLNCNSTVFHSDKSQEQEIKSVHDKMKHLTGKRKMKKENIKIPDDGKGKQRELLHFYEERPDYNLKLSFVKLNQVSDVGVARNQEMVDATHKYIDKYDKAHESKLHGMAYKIEMFFKNLKFRLSGGFEKYEQDSQKK